MNNNAVTTEELIIQEEFDLIPSEVQDFMGSSAFELILTGIQEGLTLTVEQKEFVREAAFETLLARKSQEEINDALIKQGFSTETAIQILYLIQEEIVSRAKNITEFFAPTKEEIEEENLLPSATIETGNSDVLANLAARLSQSSVITPSKRDYSITNSDSSSIPKSAPEKSFDPYREIPEK